MGLNTNKSKWKMPLEKMNHQNDTETVELLCDDIIIIEDVDDSRERFTV